MGGARSGWEGGQGGCERRIEVFVKIQKKIFFFGGGGRSEEGRVGLGGGGKVRLDVIEELKILGKFIKRKFRGGGSVLGGSGGRVRVDVNEEFNYFLKIQKRIGGGGSGGRGGEG